jgi:hypothetical protein
VAGGNSLSGFCGEVPRCFPHAKGIERLVKDFSAVSDFLNSQLSTL